jgi:hypothetical protein
LLVFLIVGSRDKLVLFLTFFSSFIVNYCRRRDFVYQTVK